MTVPCAVAMLQSGFDPTVARVIGTPVEPILKEAIRARPGPLPASDHAAALLDTLWGTEMSMSERNSLFVKAPPVLEGMTLTKPPTGGFGSAARSVIVGAGPGGAEFSTRLSTTMFMQPGYPGKYAEVGPVDAVAVSDVTPPFRTADCKTHLPGNPMTVARFDQEVAASATRAACVMDAADPPVPAELSFDTDPAKLDVAGHDQQPQAGEEPMPPTAPPRPSADAVSRLTTSVNAATGLRLRPAWGVDALAGAGYRAAGSALGNGSGSGSAGSPPFGSSGSAVEPFPAFPNGGRGAVPSFVQQLKGWWAGVSATPGGLFQKATWATDNQWEPVVILAACAVVVIILLACLLSKYR